MKTSFFLLVICTAFAASLRGASADTIRFFTSHTGPSLGSPPELIPGTAEYQTNAIFMPGEDIHVWAQCAPGDNFYAIGIDLVTHDGATINGPLMVHNPSFPAFDGYLVCRWRGTANGQPALPPATPQVNNVRMVHTIIPYQECSEFVGVSNPVNQFGVEDGFNDPLTNSVLLFSFKADGGQGPGYMLVDSLLIVTGNPPAQVVHVYFGWGDAPVIGNDVAYVGLQSACADWWVSPDDDQNGWADLIGNCTTPDTDGDGIGDVCDPCPNRRLGDVNNDGVVDTDDIPWLVFTLLDSMSASVDERCAADIDGSIDVNGLDIAAFLQLLR